MLFASDERGQAIKEEINIITERRAESAQPVEKDLVAATNGD